MLYTPLLLLFGALATRAADADGQTTLTEHTLQVDSAAAAPAVSLEGRAWLTGEGLGAMAEEDWLPPSGGAMGGVFRLIRDGSIQLYELVWLVEEDGSLVPRLKLLGPDLVGWEAKGEGMRVAPTRGAF